MSKTEQTTSNKMSGIVQRVEILLIHPKGAK